MCDVKRVVAEVKYSNHTSRAQMQPSSVVQNGEVTQVMVPLQREYFRDSCVGQRDQRDTKLQVISYALESHLGEMHAKRMRNHE